jgi:hypothetical protein
MSSAIDDPHINSSRASEKIESIEDTNTSAKRLDAWLTTTGDGLSNLDVESIRIVGGRILNDI